MLVHKNLMRAGLRNNEFYLCGLKLQKILLYNIIQNNDSADTPQIGLVSQ